MCIILRQFFVFNLRGFVKTINNIVVNRFEGLIAIGIHRKEGYFMFCIFIRKLQKASEIITETILVMKFKVRCIAIFRGKKIIFCKCLFKYVCLGEIGERNAKDWTNQPLGINLNAVPLQLFRVRMDLAEEFDLSQYQCIFKTIKMIGSSIYT